MEKAKKYQECLKEQPRVSLKYLLWAELTMEVEYVALVLYTVSQWYQLEPEQFYVGEPKGAVPAPPHLQANPSSLPGEAFSDLIPQSCL